MHFLLDMNKSQNRTFFLNFFTAIKSFFVPRRSLQILKSLPFHINLKPEKGTPFGASLQV